MYCQIGSLAHLTEQCLSCKMHDMQTLPVIAPRQVGRLDVALHILAYVNL